MGVTATTRLPAGWYPDPEGGDHRRWWDGQEWTQYTAAFQRQTSVEEVPIAAAETPADKKPGKVRAARKLRRVEATEENVEAVGEKAAADKSGGLGRSAAVRLGRWIAGAVHGPSIKKRRRAHRSTR